MYAAGQISVNGHLVGTAPPVAPPVAPPAITGSFGTTDSNHIPPVPPRTPTGRSNDPIFVTTGSPKKRLFKANARTQIKKGKKRAKFEQSSSPVRQPDEPPAPATSISRWPEVVIVTNSEDDTTAAVALPSAPALVVAPLDSLAPMPIGHSSSPEQEAARTPHPTTRRRPAQNRTARRARRNASPRFTSSPDDMFLSDSPPRNQLTATATTAPPVDPFDGMFNSDSSDELPLSLFFTARQAPVAPVVPFTVNSVVDLGNGPISSQNTCRTPSSTRASRGLSSPVAFSSQPSNLVSNNPSMSRLLSPIHDRSQTPLYFPASPLLSGTPQGFSPSGPAYTTGLLPHRHLSNHNFDSFLEKTLFKTPRR